MAPRKQKLNDRSDRTNADVNYKTWHTSWMIKMQRYIMLWIITLSIKFIHVIKLKIGLLKQPTYCFLALFGFSFYFSKVLICLRTGHRLWNDWTALSNLHPSTCVGSVTLKIPSQSATVVPTHLEDRKLRESILESRRELLCHSPLTKDGQSYSTR